MYDFVGGFCLDAPESDEDFYQSALAFGRFQEMLSQFPAETLYETIPEFHNTIYRYGTFRETLAADPCGRAAGVQQDIDFILRRRRAPPCSSGCGSLGAAFAGDPQRHQAQQCPSG